MPLIVPIKADHLPAVHALNQRFVVEMSALTPERLAELVSIAAYARCAPPADGFLIAFDETSPYDGGHFQMFKSRYDRFVYVDRIAVAAHAQGQGIAAALYADLFAWARTQGQTRITCEVNIQPPNAASEAFHTRLGFREIGQATIEDGAKTVNYLVRELNA